MGREGTEKLYHVTVLSNLVLAYDKYSRRYEKSRLPRTTYPDRFFLLKDSELSIGVTKTESLLAGLGLPGNRRIVLETKQRRESLRVNTRTGLGCYVMGGGIVVSGVYWIEEGVLIPVLIEEAIAAGYRVHGAEIAAFESLVPRTMSVLPIARGCQAACSFCFSHASISSEQKQKKLALSRVRELCVTAKDRGAKRFVVTGGGEPGLLAHSALCELLQAGSGLGRSILITNAHHLAAQEEGTRGDMLSDYHEAGLRVLSISRHHFDSAVSERVMKLSTNVESVVQTWRNGAERWPKLKLRLVCVLQKGAVDSSEGVENYVEWAARLGVAEICFKELYVSTSVDSVYYVRESNRWSERHQVSLLQVSEFAERFGFKVESRLPWGAPIYSGRYRNIPMRIAAYTEPSLYWERTQAMARSWNLLADGRCFASLEDMESEIVGDAA